MITHLGQPTDVLSSSTQKEPAPVGQVFYQRSIGATSAQSVVGLRPWLVALVVGCLTILQSCTRYSGDEQPGTLADQRNDVPESWQSPQDSDRHIDRPIDQDQPSTSPAPMVDPPADLEPTDQSQSAPIGPIDSDQLYAWVSVLDNQQITEMIEQSLRGNFSLAQSQNRLESARRAANIGRADQFPQLSIQAGTQRARANPAGARYTTNATAGLNLRWDIDWLGKINDSRRQAVARHQSAWYQHRQNQLNLATNVARAWYQLEESQLALSFQQESLNVLRENHDIIDRAYQSGIADSLDYLLSRNDLAVQSAVTRDLEHTVERHSRALQLLLGVYPNGQLRCAADQTSSVESLVIPAGMPADLLRRRPDLNAAWYDVLAADLALAVATKDRFPNLSLTGSYGGASPDLERVVDSGFQVWSLGISLLQNLFDGGRRLNFQAQKRSELASAEQLWLEKIYQAFSEVENLLSQKMALDQQLEFNKISLTSSEKAYHLSFERYVNGIEGYTRVLQAQRRMLEAEGRWVRNRGQLRRNRVALLLALGGYWSDEKLALSDNLDERAHSAVER